MLTMSCNTAYSSFLSTLSLRRATAICTQGPGTRWNFYPRSPCGERLLVERIRPTWKAHFYPRSPCGERPQNPILRSTPAHISIHALLAESDLDAVESHYHEYSISIHTLLAESDQSRGSASMPRYLFLSTLSLRRATLATWQSDYLYRDFYPRSPCGERRILVFCGPQGSGISIHALLAESDITLLKVFLTFSHFYPRSPCGERPARSLFSIHFLNFYPRSPCGERQYT